MGRCVIRCVHIAMDDPGCACSDWAHLCQRGQPSRECVVVKHAICLWVKSNYTEKHGGSR